MNTHGMHEVLAETQAGKLIFPEVVRRLLEVDVESYFCNWRRNLLYARWPNSRRENDSSARTHRRTVLAAERNRRNSGSADRRHPLSRVCETRNCSRCDRLLVLSHWQESALLWPSRRIPCRGISAREFLVLAHQHDFPANRRMLQQLVCSRGFTQRKALGHHRPD